MTAFIAYLRVSTFRQGQSGLGLEAQKAAIDRFTGAVGVIGAYTEIESGKRCDRPALQAALKQCHTTGATLVVAKLDRLARDVAFIANLMNSGVEFVACDMPHANRLTLHILAAVAEDEARRTSERTKAALAEAKQRGVVLGGFRGTTFSARDRAKGRERQKQLADENARKFAPMLVELRLKGHGTYQSLADALNSLKIPSPKGQCWSAMQVRRVELRHNIYGSLIGLIHTEPC